MVKDLNKNIRLAGLYLEVVQVLHSMYKGDENDQKKLMVLPMIMNAALSLELSLKTLYRIDTRKVAPKKHHLDSLFMELDQKTRINLNTLCEEENLQGILTDNRNIFVDVRYLESSINVPVKTLFRLTENFYFYSKKRVEDLNDR